MTYRIREPLQISNEDGTDVFTLNSEDIPDGYGFVRVGNSIVGHEIVPSGGMTGQTLTRNGALSWAGPSIDNFSNTVTSLYVSASGDDGYGDGSIGNPFATPQAAIDAIPFSIAKGSIVSIYCGAGRFPYPDCSRLPTTIRVTIYGDTSNPIISLDANDVAFALVPGKLAQWTANVGAWVGTITNGSHWVLQDNLGYGFLDFPDYANVSLASTSPNLVVAANYDPNLYAGMSVHAYATVFYMNASNANGQNAVYMGPTPHGALRTDGDGLFITGIELEVPTVLLRVAIVNTFLFACKLSTTSGGTTQWWFEDSVVSVYSSANQFIYLHDSGMAWSNVLSSGVTTAGDCELDSGAVFLSGATVSVGGGLSITGGSASSNGIDFEGTGTCFTFTPSGGRNGSMYINGSITVGTQRTSFLTTGSAVGVNIFRNSGTVTGAIVGSAVTLTNGAQYIGAKAQCNGTLTASVSQIIVGGNAGTTFALLPTTDAAAGSPQFCRAN